MPRLIRKNVLEGGYTGKKYLRVLFEELMAQPIETDLTFIHSFIHFLISIIIEQFNTKIINIKKIKKRKKL